MTSKQRDYTTWEEDFCTDQAQLRGYANELVASIDSVETRKGKEWILTDRDGKEVCRRAHKEDVMRLAEQLVGPKHAGFSFASPSDVLTGSVLRQGPKFTPDMRDGTIGLPETEEKDQE